MKSLLPISFLQSFHVAPFTGAWIEIPMPERIRLIASNVAPFTGAWIEISSLPLYKPVGAVAPFTGAWIEI